MRHVAKAGALLTGTEWEAATTHYDPVTTVAAAGATETLSPGFYDLTLTADCTVTLSGATDDHADIIVAELHQDGTGGWTVTWPGTVTWIHGEEPVLRTDANAVDVVVLWSVDGTNWLGKHSNPQVQPTPPVLAPVYGLGRAATAAVGAANRGIFVPCYLPAPATLTGVRLKIENSTGNGDVGLYSSAGARLASHGGAAWAGTGIRTVSFSASYAAAPGWYWLAASASSNTATFAVGNVGDTSGPINAQFMESAYPLPSTFTSAGETSRNLILAGIITGGLA